MKVIVICLLGLSIGLFSQEQAPAKIQGKWKMHKVIQSKKDVTQEHDPFKERTINFKPTGEFESAGRPFGKNSGKYSLINNSDTLFLDSDQGPQDDSYWLVSFQGDTMTWQGFGTEWADNFQLVHVRFKN